MPALTVAAVTELYARQSHAIDEGDGPAWAGTFTDDGSFSSPTYGDPIVGREALTAFADGVAATVSAEGERQRHWMNSTVVDAEAGTARSYLMIVRIGADEQPRLVRHVVVSDELAVTDEGQVLVRARTVRRDP